jgi:hypothetical protein
MQLMLSPLLFCIFSFLENEPSNWYAINLWTRSALGPVPEKHTRAHFSFTMKFVVNFSTFVLPTQLIDSVVTGVKLETSACGRFKII